MRPSSGTGSVLGATDWGDRDGVPNAPLGLAEASGDAGSGTLAAGDPQPPKRTTTETRQVGARAARTGQFLPLGKRGGPTPRATSGAQRLANCGERLVREGREDPGMVPVGVEPACDLEVCTESGR